MAASSKIGDFITGGLIGTFMSVLIFFDGFTAFSEPPYEDVEIMRFQRAGSALLLDTVFTKNWCTLRYLDVFGETFDTWERLTWVSSNGNTSAFRVDPGPQRFIMTIDLPENTNIEKVEVRTRHECGDEEETVDSVFFSGYVSDADIVERLDMGDLP